MDSIKSYKKSLDNSNITSKIEESRGYLIENTKNDNDIYLGNIIDDYNDIIKDLRSELDIISSVALQIKDKSGILTDILGK